MKFKQWRALCIGAMLLATVSIGNLGCAKPKTEDPEAIEAARQEHISQAQREMQDIKDNK